MFAFRKIVNRSANMRSITGVFPFRDAQYAHISMSALFQFRTGLFFCQRSTAISTKLVACCLAHYPFTQHRSCSLVPAVGVPNPPAICKLTRGTPVHCRNFTRLTLLCCNVHSAIAPGNNLGYLCISISTVKTRPFGIIWQMSGKRESIISAVSAISRMIGRSEANSSTLVL